MMTAANDVDRARERDVFPSSAKDAVALAQSLNMDTEDGKPSLEKICEIINGNSDRFWKPSEATGISHRDTSSPIEESTAEDPSARGKTDSFTPKRRRQGFLQFDSRVFSLIQESLEAAIDKVRDTKDPSVQLERLQQTLIESLETPSEKDKESSLVDLPTRIARRTLRSLVNDLLEMVVDREPLSAPETPTCAPSFLLCNEVLDEEDDIIAPTQETTFVESNLICHEELAMFESNGRPTNNHTKDLLILLQVLKQTIRAKTIVLTKKRRASTKGDYDDVVI